MFSYKLQKDNIVNENDYESYISLVVKEKESPLVHDSITLRDLGIKYFKNVIDELYLLNKSCEKSSKKEKNS